MGRSGSRFLFVSGLAGLVFFSLRPSPRVDFVVDAALMPVRVLAEVVRPAQLFRSRAVRAADQRLQDLEAADRRDRGQLLEGSSAFAVPEREELTVLRRFVRAEVIERAEGDVDRLIVQVESNSCQGLRPGMPVVSGEVFVGRLHAVDTPVPGQALIDLVTRRDFFVGARVEPDLPPTVGVDPIRLVVGGVRAVARGEGTRETEDVLLDVHNPSRRGSSPGRVLVDEGDSGSEPYRVESRGFLLGTTVPGPGEESDEHALEEGLTPFLDYAAGLFQVAIVCPQGIVRDEEHAPVDVLEDRLWRRVRATSAGDPSRWREGQKLGAGRLNGVRTGAAVASGLRLVGRVSRAGFLTADVALLGDPGLWVPAIARLEGRPEPLVLGRLVSLGRDRTASGAEVILFHWDAIVPLEEGAAGEDAVHAVLYTGSGEPLVPRGSLLGEVDLPRGPGPHILRVEEPVDTRDLGSLWVRLAVPQPVPEPPQPSGRADAVGEERSP